MLDRASVVGKEFSVADVEALSPSGERSGTRAGGPGCPGPEGIRGWTVPRRVTERGDVQLPTHADPGHGVRRHPQVRARGSSRAVRGLVGVSSRWAHRGIGGESSVTTWPSPTGIGSRSAFPRIRWRRSGIGRVVCSPRPGSTGGDTRRHARNREAVGTGGGPAPERRPGSAPSCRPPWRMDCSNKASRRAPMHCSRRCRASPPVSGSSGLEVRARLEALTWAGRYRSPIGGGR